MPLCLRFMFSTWAVRPRFGHLAISGADVEMCSVVTLDVGRDCYWHEWVDATWHGKTPAQGIAWLKMSIMLWLRSPVLSGSLVFRIS